LIKMNERPGDGGEKRPVAYWKEMKGKEANKKAPAIRGAKRGREIVEKRAARRFFVEGGKKKKLRGDLKREWVMEVGEGIVWKWQFATGGKKKLCGGEEENSLGGGERGKNIGRGGERG